jgi:hypothetical protein
MREREAFVMKHLSVLEAARRLKARPRDISDLFYRRRLRDDLCPIVGGRRLIPEGYVETIAAELTRAGRPVEIVTVQGCPKEG